MRAPDEGSAEEGSFSTESPAITTRSSIAASLKTARKELRDSEMAERMKQLIAATRHEINEARKRADDAAAERRWKRCEDELSGALKLNENDPGLYSYRSFARLNQKKTRRAMADAEKAIALEPESPRGYYRRACALMEEQRWPEAGAEFVRTLERAPDDVSSERKFDNLISGMRSGRKFFQRAKSDEASRAAGGAMTPPPAATAPGACAPPALGTATTTTLRVSWQAVDDDGGAEPLRYDVEMARVNICTRRGT